MRLNSLRFFRDGSDAPFKEVGAFYNQFPFAFEADPGEEVFAFFGATYPDGPNERPILAWLGVWMKHTG
jgi:hypothetical protein